MIGVVAVLLVTVRTIPSQAVSRVRLSQTKRTYDMTGLWDKLKLKNVSSKAKIRWKTTDSMVVKIRERKGAGIWYEVIGEGKASIMALYNRKRYSCRITVKLEDEPEETASPTPTEATTVSGDEPAECTPTPAPTISPSGQTTKTTFRSQVEERLSEFITADMSEYDKMLGIVKHVSNDYDYQLGQFDFEVMFRTGKGDCMASRYLVAYMARVAGLKAFPIASVDAHGEALVRADDKVYMTITGTNMPRPRTYMIYEEGMESLERIANNGNPSLFTALGFS